MNMRRTNWIVWLLVGAVGALVFIWAYPRAFPYAPKNWQISQNEATEIALERLRTLGPAVEDPYVVTRLVPEALLERRLLIGPHRSGPTARQAREHLGEQIVAWEVLVYPPGALRERFTYQARISLKGDLLALRLEVDPKATGGPLMEPAAIRRGNELLSKHGIDLAHYQAPSIRSRQLESRTDWIVRYTDRRPAPGDSRHGVDVYFSGDRLSGFEYWFEDPNEAEIQQVVQSQFTIGGLGGITILFSSLFLLVFPFLKRYHEGLIGVRRGVQILALVLAAGLFGAFMLARPESQNIGFGFAPRSQMSWIYGFFVLLFGTVPSSIVGLLAWSVGESVCRERWGSKLAAFDALFQRRANTATVAQSALRGLACGVALAAALCLFNLMMQEWNAWPFASIIAATQLGHGKAWIPLGVGFFWGYLPILLTCFLCVLPMLVRRFGTPVGATLATVITALATYSGLTPAPAAFGLVVAILCSAALVGLFLAYDLLTVLITVYISQVLVAGGSLLFADHAGLEMQIWVALGLGAVPLLLSIRALGSDREFVYNYDDIPPHVRRIAERERQRVELDTARNIQSSILPDLPPRVGGFDVAHVYLPATEVGGDFYDVLALEDGRLAVAVGDVAGHGVSSGLVMSMARSALAVQTTFDPEVESVFRTLNRMIYQTARKRLLTTLCYAILDPNRGEISYASAGHLYPYVVGKDGRVEPLESTAYPLGVRSLLTIESKVAKLKQGDTLFLYSDGLVEATSERSVEPFGFDRLEQSLARHADGSVLALRDGVLSDLKKFTSGAPRTDDLTVLVLRAVS